MDIIGVIKNSHLLNVTIVRFKMEFTDWRSLGLDRYPWSSSTGRSYRRSGKLMYNHLKCAKNEENRISIYCTFLSHLIESLMLVILRQGTSPQYQYCYLDLVTWYWDECGNPSGRGCKKSIGQIKSLLGLQSRRKRQISPPSYMNIASL